MRRFNLPVRASRNSAMMEALVDLGQSAWSLSPVVDRILPKR